MSKDSEVDRLRWALQIVKVNARRNGGDWAEGWAKTQLELSDYRAAVAALEGAGGLTPEEQAQLSAMVKQTSELIERLGRERDARKSGEGGK
jgi:hypothetical protein